MTNTSPPASASGSGDDDLFNIFLALVLMVILFFVAKLLYYPFMYIMGFWVMPVHLFGILGSLLVSLIFGGILAYKASTAPDLLKALAKEPFLVCVTLFYFLGSLFPSFTAPITDVCQSSGALWFLNCKVNAQLFVTTDVGTLFALFVLPSLPFLMYAFWLIVAGFLASGDDPFDRYRRKMDIDDYIRTQTPLYPHLAFYAKLNPLTFPLYTGNTRLLDNAKRFVFGKFLIHSFVQRPKKLRENETDENTPDTEINPLDRIPQLDPFRFEQEMLRQLGSVWVSAAALSPLEVIIFSTVLPRLHALDKDMDEKDADKTLKDLYARIDENWAQVGSLVDSSGDVVGHFDDKFIQKRRDIIMESLQSRDDPTKPHPIVQELLTKHAYVRTILYAALTKVRTLGVLQSSEFSWVFYFDRELWACLNNVGRPSFYCECLAVPNHYLLEQKNESALFATNFDSALKGLQDMLASYHYSPELIDAYTHWQETGDVEQLLPAFPDL